MAKKYGGYIRRTGRSVKRYRKAGRVVVLKTNPYRGRQGLPEGGGTARYYPSIPKVFKVAVPWHFDTRHEIPVGGLSIPDGTTQTISAYWFLDPLDLGQRVGPPSTSTNPTSGISQFAYSPAHWAFMSMFAEMRYKTTTYDLEFTADWMRSFVNSSAAANFVQDEPNVSLMVGVIPGNYFRLTSTTFHNSSQAGQIFPNPSQTEIYDYYSILSQAPGAKQLFLPTNGNQDSRKTCKLSIDAYEHDGSTQVATASYTWDQSASRPTTTMSWPNPQQRSWLVVACRVRFVSYSATTARPSLFIRISGKCTQHVSYGDPIPSSPYSPINTFT